ncbi:response regulator transcription factor [Pseudomonas sp. CR3202]|uniref:response regulator transcription factor n=1 Tax=Pseudomonas sp. CR3202 TaxID=3351532 RepID=UPI003BF00E57
MEDKREWRAADPTALAEKLNLLHQPMRSGMEPEILARGVDPSDRLLLLLTARELQIATLVCLGRLNKQIAAQLRISEHTVNTHLRRVYSKLGVNNRAAMVFRCAAFLEHDCQIGLQRTSDRAG